MKKLILMVGLVGVLSHTSYAQTAELIKQNVRNAYAKLGKMDLDGFSTYLAQNCVDYQGPMAITGRDAVKESLKVFLTAFPGYTIEIKDISVSGNKAYVYNTFSGTQTRTLMDLPATGKKVEWTDIDILEFDKEGKITTHWVINPNAVLDQLGFHAFTQPNTMLIMEAYQKFGKGDIPGILSQCSDDIRWDVRGNVAPELANVYNGKTELINFFTILSKTFTITQFEPYRFFADGDEVTVFIKSKFLNSSDKKTYETLLVHHFILKDNKVISFKEIQDRPEEVSLAQK